MLLYFSLFFFLWWTKCAKMHIYLYAVLTHTRCFSVADKVFLISFYFIQSTLTIFNEATLHVENKSAYLFRIKNIPWKQISICTNISLIFDSVNSVLPFTVTLPGASNDLLDSKYNLSHTCTHQTHWASCLLGGLGQNHWQLQTSVKVCMIFLEVESRWPKLMICCYTQLTEIIEK